MSGNPVAFCLSPGLGGDGEGCGAAAYLGEPPGGAAGAAGTRGGRGQADGGSEQEVSPGRPEEAAWASSAAHRPEPLGDMVSERGPRRGLISRQARRRWGLGIWKGELVAKSEDWAALGPLFFDNLTAGSELPGQCPCSSSPPSPDLCAGPEQGFGGGRGSEFQPKSCRLARRLLRPATAGGCCDIPGQRLCCSQSRFQPSARRAPALPFTLSLDRSSKNSSLQPKLAPSS